MTDQEKDSLTFRFDVPWSEEVQSRSIFANQKIFYASIDPSAFEVTPEVTPEIRALSEVEEAALSEVEETIKQSGEKFSWLEEIVEIKTEVIDEVTEKK